MLKRGVGRREELRKEPAFEVIVKSQSLISDLREGRGVGPQTSSFGPYGRGISVSRVLDAIQFI